jgi:hypothetical protein
LAFGGEGQVTFRLTVSEFLQRARDCAAIADKLPEPEKQKMMEIADAWLELADEIAKGAIKNGHELPKQ